VNGQPFIHPALSSISLFSCPASIRRKRWSAAAGKLRADDDRAAGRWSQKSPLSRAWLSQFCCRYDRHWKYPATGPGM